MTYMVGMKTTVILPDALMEKVRKRAKKEHSTLTRILEQALRDYLERPPQKPAEHSPRIEPFPGDGYADATLEGNWPRIRDLIYEDRALERR